MEKGKKGVMVPDYLRMILMCQLCASMIWVCRADNGTVAKVYSAPLNLKETPLTLAVNLSARLGNEACPFRPCVR